MEPVVHYLDCYILFPLCIIHMLPISLSTVLLASDIIKTRKDLSTSDIKKVTCPVCLRQINYLKGIKL